MTATLEACNATLLKTQVCDQAAQVLAVDGAAHALRNHQKPPPQTPQCRFRVRAYR